MRRGISPLREGVCTEFFGGVHICLAVGYRTAKICFKKNSVETLVCAGHSGDSCLGPDDARQLRRLTAARPINRVLGRAHEHESHLIQTPERSSWLC